MADSYMWSFATCFREVDEKHEAGSTPAVVKRHAGLQHAILIRSCCERANTMLIITSSPTPAPRPVISATNTRTRVAIFVVGECQPDIMDALFGVVEKPGGAFLPSNDTGRFTVPKAR